MSETVSSFICKWLHNAGVSHVFAVPGAQIEPILSSLESDKIVLIIANHELGAAYMADGYARVSGKMGVCASIGGPGASNLLTAAMVARIDEVGVLYVTGDVPTKQKKYLSFQDTGVYGSRDNKIFQTAIDYSGLIDSVDSLFPVLENVLDRIKSNKPAHIIIPYDIQEKSVKDKTDFPMSTMNEEKIELIEYEKIANVLVEAVQRANKPVLLLGHRLIQLNDHDLIIQLAEQTGIHVATTFRAKGIFPENHPLSLRNYGFAGNKSANDFIHSNECDLIIMIGVNLSQRDTFHFNRSFLRSCRKTILIDNKTENPDIGNLVANKYLLPNLGQILENIIHILPKTNKCNSIPAISQNLIIKDAKINSFTVREGCLRLNLAVKMVRKVMPEDTMFFIDSGFHRIVGGTAWEVTKPHTFFTSDLQAPMGWAICAAIGGKLAKPDSPALVLTGDGCMRMHAMEIATAVRYSIPIVYLVSNNASYGSIERRLPSKDFGKLFRINWAEFASNIGAKGIIVNNLASLENAIQFACEATKPVIIDMQTDPFEQLPSETCIPEGLWPVL